MSCSATAACEGWQFTSILPDFPGQWSTRSICTASMPCLRSRARTCSASMGSRVLTTLFQSGSIGHTFFVNEIHQGTGSGKAQHNGINRVFVAVAEIFIPAFVEPVINDQHHHAVVDEMVDDGYP